MFVIGIDGGGTKTSAVISDPYGKVHALAFSGPSNPNSISSDQLRAELETLTQKIINQNEKAFLEADVIFGGFSGVENPLGKKLIASILNDIFQGKQILIDNDAISALYSGTLGEPGIVQISGTGSITLGVNRHGQRERAGGWGYLFDDEGSGYSLGKNALSRVFKAYDGRGSSTILVQYTLDYFSVKEVPEIIPRIYNSENPRKTISQLSKLVVQAAEEKDSIALEILSEAGKEIGAGIAAVIQKLSLQNATVKVPVVITGGVFNSSHLIKPSILNEIHKNNLKVDIIKPDIPPVGGSVVAALKSKKIELPQNFNEVFATSYQKQLEQISEGKK